MAKNNLTLEYTLRQLGKRESFERVDTKPLFLPVGRIRPETYNQAIERILATSLGRGESLESAYDHLRGDYDGDVEDFDDPEFEEEDFEQSDFANYDDSSLNTPDASLKSDAKPDAINTSPDRELSKASESETTNKMASDARASESESH